ncbi:MAG: GntR family transcriptional regulator [Clostridiaceae bacterium]
MATKYEVVVKQLEKEIVDGIFGLNSKLPTEEELMKRFDVSRNTIRKAIEILVNEGYVYQVQGSGVFLRDFSKPGCLTMRNMSGLTKSFPNDKLDTKLIELSLIDADEEIAKKMKCSIGTKVYSVKRIRYVNGEAFEIEEAYYNKDIVPYLNEEICTNSIYKYIEEDLKLKIGFADRVISCDKLTDEEAEILNLQKNDPVLVLESTNFLNSGAVFNISKEKYNYKKSKLLSLESVNRIQ